MIICLNPDCQKPENPDGTNFCLSCGTGLVPLLRERYRIISLLGSGGFGRTLLAEDTGMPSARRCVIKQLKPINNNPQIYQLVQERFQREAAVLEQLGEENSHIPSLYDYFTNAGQFYLVQQWIDGETLTNIVKQQGTLNESYVRGFITKVLEILDYVHSKGIIHRDIKPDNIIVRRRDGFPILIDFGAVKETMGTMVTSQGIPTSSIVIGTPGYMPSEQAAGKPIYSSDLYSFGLTAIYAITGKIPQELPLDHNTGDIIWHHYSQNISPELIAILTKAIQWNPGERYPKAKDMLNAFNSGVSTQPVQTPDPQESQNPPNSLQCGFFSLKPHKFDNKYGYKNEAGQIVIQPEFDEACNFSEGLAVVKNNSKFGYIDGNGLTVIPPSFNEAEDFSEGLAVVKVGSKFGYIDQKGQFVITPKFYYCSKFSEGLAVFGIYKKWLGLPYMYHYGYINKLGVIEIRPQFDIAGNFSEGLAKVWICSMGGLNGCKWGYIDRRGVVVILPQFDGAGNFCEGLASVKVGAKVGYINTTGIIAIAPQFDEATNFSQGWAKVRIGGQWSNINTKGDFVVLGS